MQEIHEGVCGNHSGPRSLFHKVILQGYYWPTIKSDAEAYVQACEPCQYFSRLTHQPAELLNSVLSPWPFAKWGVDLIGPLPQGKYKMKFAIVAIDYYTKWVEAEPLQEITEARTTGFIWRNIICRFGIPHSLVSDNGTQFDSAGLKKLCLDLGIRKHFSSVAHPQSNGQVEAVNKTIKNNLERKLNGAKGAWVDELPRVLWAYRTTCRTSTNETPFSMTYGTEAVVPTEIGEPSFRVEQFDPESNVEGLSLNLDLLEIKRDNAQIRMVANQKAVARAYNARVRIRRFRTGELVLKKIMQKSGVFSPNWEGPYRVTEPVHSVSYRIEGLDGKILPHLWNADKLRKYYQ